MLSALPDVEVTAARGVKGLASCLVENPGASCVIVHLRKPAESWIHFLSSIRESFLYVKTALILEEGQALIPEVRHFKGDPTKPGTFKELSAFIASLKGLQKRGRQRFDWPLNGTLRTADGWTRSYRVRLISASGAFLETPTETPPPGLKASLTVSFRDFSILTEVEVLSARHGTRQGSGFGVRFLSLTEGSQRVIDHIVKDGLMKHLLHPGSRVKIPSIE